MTFSKISPSSTPFLIGIDGLPGSGKSTVATALKEATGGVVIPIDDFTGWQPDPLWREHFVANILSPLTSGATSLSYQPVSWWSDHHPALVVIAPVPRVVIIEGIEALHPLLYPYFQLRLLVTADPEICLARGIARDQAQGERERITQLWQSTLEQATNYLAENQLTKRVDMSIDGTKPILIETILAQIPASTHDISG